MNLDLDINNFFDEVEDTANHLKDEAVDLYEGVADGVNKAAQWVDGEVKKAALNIARPMIRAAMWARYFFVKTSKRTKIAVDQGLFATNMSLARKSIEVGILGEAGKAALTAIDRVKSLDAFNEGAESIHE